LGQIVNSVTLKLGMMGKVAASGLLAGTFLLGAANCNAQIFQKKKKLDKSTSADNNAQPDKILYDKAMDDIKHGRQEVGRLNLQTLINTYPDSEYLAKAKLSIADSYYKEGGTSNLALAVSGYKDFIVFFPFLPEATYAQMQVAMTHYKQMEKPDRDRSQARDAEEEFQIFLQKYPNDPLAPQAQQHLREVQEVLAEGDYRIGYYYYVKGDRRAAATRLLTVVSRYPLYSKSDRALWMMGDIFEKSEHNNVAAVYYAKIVKNYPLSTLAAGAKGKLKGFGAPIPQADPNSLAWMTAEQNAPRPKTPLMKKPLELIKSGPGTEMFTAAQTGTPTMEPESDSMSTADLLTGGQGAILGRKGGGSTTGIVANVTPGGSGGGASAETVGGSTETTTPPADGAAAPPATPTEAPAPAPAVAPAAAEATGNDAAAKNPPAAGNMTETPAKGDGAAPAAGTEAKSDAASTDAAPATDAAKTGDAQSGDSKKESSSKKKKGLRKLVPW
jgi:outer membrane protein assembly factor BamD